MIEYLKRYFGYTFWVGLEMAIFIGLRRLVVPAGRFGRMLSNAESSQPVAANSATGSRRVFRWRLKPH
ncbi:MAG: hypothetical protein ACYS32_03050 [Planctomycetota bacterium]